MIKQEGFYRGVMVLGLKTRFGQQNPGWRSQSPGVIGSLRIARVSAAVPGLTLWTNPEKENINTEPPRTLRVTQKTF